MLRTEGMARFCTTRASFQVRLWAYVSIRFMPRPVLGLWVCDESPRRKMR